MKENDGDLFPELRSREIEYQRQVARRMIGGATYCPLCDLGLRRLPPDGEFHVWPLRGRCAAPHADDATPILPS